MCQVNLHGEAAAGNLQNDLLELPSSFVQAGAAAAIGQQTAAGIMHLDQMRGVWRGSIESAVYGKDQAGHRDHSSFG